VTVVHHRDPMQVLRGGRLAVYLNYLHSSMHNDLALPRSTKGGRATAVRRVAA
jgi:hypothetical protein